MERHYHARLTYGTILYIGMEQTAIKMSGHVFSREINPAFFLMGLILTERISPRGRGRRLGKQAETHKSCLRLKRRQENEVVSISKVQTTETQ